jgi:hypothetical protein
LWDSADPVGINTIHFIKCIIALSVYRTSPTFMFEDPELFPLAPGLNLTKLRTVLSGLSRNQITSSDKSEVRWTSPFSEDQSIRDGEEAMYKINRQFFIPDKSIISVDDDHLRLSASHCETLGLSGVHVAKYIFAKTFMEKNR